MGDGGGGVLSGWDEVSCLIVMELRESYRGDDEVIFDLSEISLIVGNVLFLLLKEKYINRGFRANEEGWGCKVHGGSCW